MKKTLSAVMAVAMAASIAMTAFARDNSFDSDNTIIIGGGSTNNGKIDKVLMGKENKFTVRTNEVSNGSTVIPAMESEVLAGLMKSGYLSGDVIVTNGKSNLTSTPTLKVVGGIVEMRLTFRDTWDVKDVSSKIRTRFTAKKTFYTAEEQLYTLSFTNGGDTVYMKANLTEDRIPTADEFTSDINEAKEFSLKDADRILEILNGNVSGAAKAEGSVITSFTDKKGDNTTVFMNKGDTITSTEFEIKAGYDEISNYGETITITPTEADKDHRQIIAKGEELYDNSGVDEKVTMYFGTYGDAASFEFKVSSAQKDLNLGYTQDGIEDILDAYESQGVDFEFLRFHTNGTANKNVLTNRATATFNAIGGRDTAVYEWDGKTLTELPSTYNEYDDTVTVKDIKKLTNYVIADQKLKPVQEETEAPETEAPETEGPVTPSEPSDNNQNPNTGAL